VILCVALCVRQKDAIFLFLPGLGFESVQRESMGVWFLPTCFFFVLILSLFFSRDVGSEVVLNVNNGCENKNERLPSFGELGSVDQSKTACGLFQIHACCFFLIFLILKKKFILQKKGSKILSNHTRLNFFDTLP
jgi:hypothetical protein